MANRKLWFIVIAGTILLVSSVIINRHFTSNEVKTHQMPEGVRQSEEQNSKEAPWTGVPEPWSDRPWLD